VQFRTPAIQTGHRPACKVDTAAGWTTDRVYTTVDTGYTCWTEDMVYSRDHSEVWAEGTDRGEDTADTAGTEHRPARTGY